MDMKVAVLEYRIMSWQVFLKFNHVLNKNEIDIVILDNKIIIKYIGTKENTKLPQSITLDSSNFFNLNNTSISGLSYSNDEITFRLQTEPKDKTEGSLKTQIVTKYCDNQDKYKINIEENTPYEFICRNCSSNLFLTKGFARVLELPTKIADLCAWYCHEDVTKNKSFNPEINELFYKHNYIIINENLANFKHNKRSNSISCLNCENTIGYKEEDNINIFNFAVQLKQDKNICDIYPYKRSIFLHDFIYLTKELLCDEAIFFMRKYKIWFKTTDTENKKKYIFIQAISDSETQVLKTNDQGILELKSVLKLMYKVEDQGSDTYNKWISDKFTYTLREIPYTLREIPYQMFLEAEKYLQLMSEYIPSSCQNIDDFKLCYLDL